MSEKKVALILSHMAEQAAPGREINLWPALQTRLQMSTSQPLRGTPMQTRYTSTSNRLRFAALLAIAFLLAFGLFLSTSQGQAWARQIWQFFTTTDSDRLALPGSRESAQNSLEDNPVPTYTPISLENCGNWSKPLCTFTQVAQRVDYPLKQLSDLPKNVRFEGAYVDGDIVLLRYSDGLDLIQMHAKSYNQPQVGVSAKIEAVQIGHLNGEYMQGSWYGGRGDSYTTWQSDADSQFLVWEENGTIYQIQGFGTQWTKEDLIELAESLLKKQPEDKLMPDSSIDRQEGNENLDHLTSVAEAEALVGYPVQTLNSIPPGYIFHYASVHPATQSVCLHYMFTGNDGPGPYLLIAQGPAENVPPLDVPEAETITPVDIGGADPGSGYQFIYASRKGEWACTEGGINIDLSLTWQREGKQFDVYALGGCAMTEGFTQLDLLKLAEDLTGVSTHLETELDPECLPRADDARQMADFPVLEPKWIPDGLIFDNASYGEWPGYPVVYFYYKISGQPHPDLVISQSPVQLEMGNDLQSKYSDLPQDGYELFEIAGHPAMIQSGSWLLDPNGDLFWYDQGVAETLYWEVDGILISISGPWWADDSGDSKAMLITIAEGME